MPLLVVIAALVAFLIVVTLLLLADLAERRHVQQLRLGARIESFSAFSLVHAFDPDRSLLWDTQLPVLRQLDSAGSKGCSLAQLYSFYLQSARRFPELYDGFTFEQWLAFLGTELVRIETARGFLTSHGQRFLQEFTKCRMAAERRAPASR